VWARIFYQYGPFEDQRRLVPHIITSLLRGQRAELTAGTQVRDFLHVEDVGTALATVATSSLTGIVNIGSGTGVTVRHIAETIGELIGRSDLLAFGAKPTPLHDPPYVVADTTRLRSLGWQPRYNLRSGLAQTIAWWKQQLVPNPTGPSS
ncbi:MAG: NAD-dependent epimerase/dehydratase family protein, partial [Verrucomicrobiae bacterium]|nr:NAD-dependent epimerase/dehydratase family protein [Verrucomicrobiae bacterium]